jgi:protein ImuA
MLSLVTDILPIAPGVRATTPARRVSHLSEDGTPDRDGPAVISLPPSSGDWTPKNPRLAQLAEQIRELQARGRLPAAYCPSGLTELDAGLGGGFLTAAVHELIAAREGVAACSVALRTAAHAAGGNKWIFYIDTGGDLYPPGVAQLGVPLGRLVVVRTSRVADALWACEQTLRCQAVAAVVLPLRTLDGYTSRRLQLAAETGGSLGLLVRSDEHGEPTFAASRVRLEPLVGSAGGRYMRVTVLKIREGRPREPFVVELPDAADAVPAHAVPADGAGAARRRTGG